MALKDFDPDGTTEHVAVIMKGDVYREAGLKHSEFPDIEGELYDALCKSSRSKYRDDVRNMAQNIALTNKTKEFEASIDWLDNFMRRFCLSRKKAGTYKRDILGLKIKQKHSKKPEITSTNDSTSVSNTDNDVTNEKTIINGSSDKKAKHTKEPNGNSAVDSCSDDEKVSSDTEENGKKEKISSNKEEKEKKVKISSDKEEKEKISSDKEVNGKKEQILSDTEDNGENEKILSDTEEKGEKESSKNVNDDKKAKSSDDNNELEGKSSSDDNEPKVKKFGFIKLRNLNELLETNKDENKSSSKKDETTDDSKGKKASKSDDKKKNVIDDDEDEDDEKKEEEEEEEEEEEDEDKDTEVRRISDSDDDEDAEESSSATTDSDDDIIPVSSSSDDEKTKSKPKYTDEENLEYTKKEDKYYENNLDKIKESSGSKSIRCTACNEQVNHLVRDLVFTHPILGVLMCKRCRGFYGKGSFQKDREGFDEYCRWCANGGDLVICDDCTNGFCSVCIKRNLGRVGYTEATKAKKFACYTCNKKPLTELRATHRFILDNLKEEQDKQNNLSRCDKKNVSLKDRFAALKQRRKEKDILNKLEVRSKMLQKKLEKKVKKETKEEDWMLKCTDDMKTLLNTCITQITKIEVKLKMNKNSDEVKMQSGRRLLRLNKAMQENFLTLESDINEICGKNAEAVSPSKKSSNNDNECDGKKSSNKLEGKEKKDNKSEKKNKDRNEKKKHGNNDEESDDELKSEKNDEESEDELKSEKKKKDKKKKKYDEEDDESEYEVKSEKRKKDKKKNKKYDNDEESDEELKSEKNKKGKKKSDDEEESDEELKSEKNKKDKKGKKKYDDEEESDEELKNKKNRKDKKGKKKYDDEESDGEVHEKQSKDKKVKKKCDDDSKESDEEMKSENDEKEEKGEDKMKSEKRKEDRKQEKKSGDEEESDTEMRSNISEPGEYDNGDDMSPEKVDEIKKDKKQERDSHSETEEDDEKAKGKQNKKEENIRSSSRSKNKDISYKESLTTSNRKSSRISKPQKYNDSDDEDNSGSEKDDDDSNKKNKRKKKGIKEKCDKGNKSKIDTDDEDNDNSGSEKDNDSGKKEKQKKGIKKKCDKGKKSKMDTDDEDNDNSGSEKDNDSGKKEKQKEKCDKGKKSKIDTDDDEEDNSGSEKDNDSIKKEKRKKKDLKDEEKKSKMDSDDEDKDNSGSEKDNDSSKKEKQKKDIKEKCDAAKKSKMDSDVDEDNSGSEKDNDSIKKEKQKKDIKEKCDEGKKSKMDSDDEDKDNSGSEKDNDSSKKEKQKKKSIKEKCEKEEKKLKVKESKIDSDEELSEDKNKTQKNNSSDEEETSSKRKRVLSSDASQEKEESSSRQKKKAKVVKKEKSPKKSPQKAMPKQFKEPTSSSDDEEDENDEAKALLLASESDSSSDDRGDKQKETSKRKMKKKKAKLFSGPKSIKLAREKKQLDMKCVIPVDKMPKDVLTALKEEEMIDLSEFPSFYKIRNKRKQKKKRDASDSENEGVEDDAEFEDLMKFKEKKGKSKKGKPVSSGEDNEEDEEEPGSEDESKEKKIKEDDKEKVKKERKKKEGLLDISLDKDGEEAEENEDDDVEEADKGLKKKKSGLSFNEKVKKSLLLSDDEENEDSDDESENEKKDNLLDELDFEKTKKKFLEKQLKKEEEDKTEEEEEDKENEGNEENEDEKKDDDSDLEIFSKKGKKGYISLKFSSDEEEKEKDDDDDDDDDDSDFENPRKKIMFIDSASSSDEGGGKKRKKKKDSSSEFDSSDDEVSDKPKRRRIRRQSSSSGSDKDEDKEKESPSKKIRKIIRDEDLTESTKNATQEEQDRRDRIKNRQADYNKIFEIDVEADQKDMGKLVLDFDPETKKELVTVNEKIVSFLKPHQFSGIQFMWNATIESVEMLKKDEKGGGCILAHCMGLGKTLQVIAFIHTLLTQKLVKKHMSRVMVFCPVNTIYNWIAEFKSWLKGKLNVFDVVELCSARDLWGRAHVLDEWYNEGGVCIIGYDMFRNLSNDKNKRYKGKMKEIFQRTLIDPGPDVVVCDEGHLLKNEKSAISIGINRVRTLRRIILTGTPLQNNLKEYHCMIQFVKPNLLGTKKEFLNRFVNPIDAGQCLNAHPRDVKRMKRRAHILHNLLEGCVQRKDYTVLQPFLPPKLEFVVAVQLSDLQIKLYRHYITNLAQGGPKRQGSGLFVDFNNLSRIWSHPAVLDLALRKAQGEYDVEEDEMSDFICDDTSDSDSEPKSKKKKKKEKEKEKEDTPEPENDEIEEIPALNPMDGITDSGKIKPDWWRKVIMDIMSREKKTYDEDELFNNMENGGKLFLLLDILRECGSIGDKLLVFSQSIPCLTMIENFLAMVDNGTVDLPTQDDGEEEALPTHYKKWRRDLDYLRLDGSVSAEIRKQHCKYFNDPKNDRCRLYLISTRAGGIGINLVAANRVIIFDSCWNPSLDTQSIFRVYRFGQKKPCYVYRFVAQGTMEEKIYSRQVAKLSTALRVVDEQQIKRYFDMAELSELYEFNPADPEERETPKVPEDRLLAGLLMRRKEWIVGYHEHDSLLENQTEEELTEEERKAAWEDFENEKKAGFAMQNNRAMPMPGMNSGMGLFEPIAPFDFNNVLQSIYKQNPSFNTGQMKESAVLATRQIQKIHLSHYQRIQSILYSLKNPMVAVEMKQKILGFYYDKPETPTILAQQLKVLERNIQLENEVISQLSSSVKLTDSLLRSAGVIRGHPSSSNSANVSNFASRPPPAKPSPQGSSKDAEVVTLE